jgi:biotin carboxyl carrier protein
MKMETTVTAPKAGRFVSASQQPGEQVNMQDSLGTIQ